MTKRQPIGGFYLSEPLLHGVETAARACSTSKSRLLRTLISAWIDNPEDERSCAEGLINGYRMLLLDRIRKSRDR